MEPNTYEPSERTVAQIDNNFTFHKPVEGQAARYIRLRDEFCNLALTLAHECPESRELSCALTNLEQACFWANAAIARNEK